MIRSIKNLARAELAPLALATVLAATFAAASTALAESISGTVTKDPLVVESGNTFVVLFDENFLGGDVGPVAITVVPDPGEGLYEFTGLATERWYYLFCWLDVDGDSSMTEPCTDGPPMEPIGIYGFYDGTAMPVPDSLYLTQDTTGVDMTLIAPPEGVHEPGSISGTVTYTGGYEPTTTYVGLFDEPEMDDPVCSVELRQPGAYTVHSVQDGTYYVGAFMDLNHNEEPDPGEPLRAYNPTGGCTPIPVMVQGAPVTGIDIVLVEEPSRTRETSWSTLKASYR